MFSLKKKVRLPLFYCLQEVRTMRLFDFEMQVAPFFQRRKCLTFHEEKTEQLVSDSKTLISIETVERLENEVWLKRHSSTNSLNAATFHILINNNERT